MKQLWLFLGFGCGGTVTNQGKKHSYLIHLNDFYNAILPCRSIFLRDTAQHRSLLLLPLKAIPAQYQQI